MPKPNPTSIAVLEHDLFGIQPQAGSVAALTIALRRTAVCIKHKPIDVTSIGDPGPVAICQGCGSHMVRADDGEWTIA